MSVHEQEKSNGATTPRTSREDKEVATSDQVEAPAADGNQQEARKVELPRFRGRLIPPLDRAIIKILPPVLIIALIITVTVNPSGAAEVINQLRTFVTSGFTWLFILYSLIAVAVCVWLSVSRVGKIRLGGPKAKPEHNNFAWYSMLFACGQGIGLIFWSVAQPIMMREESPVVPAAGGEGGMVWTYFHWGLTAWAMYCVVAVCLAYSHHNLGKTLTFREATVDILPKKAQRSAGVVVELLAIMATVLGLATSFGFAALQFTSGLASFTGLASGPALWIAVIVALGGLTAVSAFLGVNKGMKRISETNSILSIVLMVGVFIFGPTVFIISNMSQTFGSFFYNFLPMSFWTGCADFGRPPGILAGQLERLVDRLYLVLGHRLLAVRRWIHRPHFPRTHDSRIRHRRHRRPLTHRDGLGRHSRLRCYPLRQRIRRLHFGRRRRGHLQRPVLHAQRGANYRRPSPGGRHDPGGDLLHHEP